MTESLFSQTTVPTYSYDAAGNRVLRQMLLLGGRAENPSGSKMAQQTVSEEFNGVVISAFPNPSKGEITIEFPKELLENGLVEFQLLGSDGSVLKTGTFSETRNPLDISAFSNGSYTLLLYSKKEEAFYLRILKQ